MIYTQILLQIVFNLVFTWLHSNFNTSYFCFVVSLLRSNQTKTDLDSKPYLGKKLHGSGVYTSPYNTGTMLVKNLTCFFRFQTCTLSHSKIAQFLQSHVNVG